MAKKVKISVISGTENAHKLTISDTIGVIHHVGITRAAVHSSTGVLLGDSSLTPNAFDRTSDSYLLIKFGLLGIAPGTYTCYLLLYDVSHTVGIACETEIVLTILP